MGHCGDWGSRDELKGVAARLEAGRAEADSVRLDQIKRNVLARVSVRDGGLWFMRSLLASVLSAAALLGGTGSAIAIAGQGSAGGPIGGAASGQYCNGKFANPGKCKGHHKHHCHGNKGKHGRKGQHGKHGHHGKKHRHHGKKHGKPGGTHGPTTNGLPQSY